MPTCSAMSVKISTLGCFSAADDSSGTLPSLGSIRATSEPWILFLASLFFMFLRDPVVMLKIAAVT